MVHGDLRPPIVMIQVTGSGEPVSPVSLKLVDFDWAGLAGEAHYPYSQRGYPLAGDCRLPHFGGSLCTDPSKSETRIFLPRRLGELGAHRGFWKWEANIGHFKHEDEAYVRGIRH